MKNIEIKMDTDLKTLLVVNDEQIKENAALKELEGFLPNGMKWKEFLDIKENNDMSDLEKFYIYKFAIELKLYKINDCDTLNEVFTYFKAELDKLAIVEKVELPTKAKNRTIKVTLNDNTELYLDTDTGYSLATDANEFLRSVIKKFVCTKWWDSTYRKRYGCKKSYAYMYFYFYEICLCLRNYDVEKKNKDKSIFKPKNGEYPSILDICEKICKNEELNNFKLLNKRARLTHTLSNVILVPETFNVPRYGTLKDDMFKTIKSYEYIRDNKIALKENFLINNIPFDEIDFIYENFKKNYPDLDGTNMSERCGSINKSIEN